MYLEDAMKQFQQGVYPPKIDMLSPSIQSYLAPF